MNQTTTNVEGIAGITRAEVSGLAATENARVHALLASLSDDDWGRQTDCPLWDVRALSGHVLGAMEGFASFREFVHQMRAAGRAAGDGPLVDAMTAVQVRERSQLGRQALLSRLAEAGPRVARARAKVPAPLRHMPMKQEIDGMDEKWTMGYLLDVILTRDTWMHRVDIAHATGREFVLTPDHDGRIIADVVAEWARRHGKSFVLELAGSAGGIFVSGEGGPRISLDAVEYCRLLSGRGEGDGLLAHHVPF